VLVTGGAGFIGGHVVEALLAHGLEVVVLDVLHPAAHHERPRDLHAEAEYRFEDVGDRAAVERALAGVDAVSHQAAMVGLGVDLADLPEYVRNNDLGTAVLLAAIAARGGVDRVVLASSMVVYGEGDYRCEQHGPVRPEPRAPGDLDAGRYDPGCPRCGRALTPGEVTEDAPPDPRNVYASTKLAQEHLASSFARETAVPVAALRYHNVYGPRMPRDTPYAGVASIFRSALAAGRAPQIFEDGRQRRDFVHVRDVARANVLALTCERPPAGPFNIASGTPHTVGEMAFALAAAFGPAAPTPQIVGGSRLGDVRHIVASPERARRELGFAARITFEDGMREFASAPLRGERVAEDPGGSPVSPDAASARPSIEEGIT
jgi:dTDP-L-rhamnose 4-epimerase